MPETDRIRALTQRPLIEFDPPPQPPLRRLMAWWTPRRLAVMTVLWPMFLTPLWLLAGGIQPLGLLALISFGSALSLTTYTPAPGQTLSQVLGSPCATFGGVLPVLCSFSLMAQPGGSPWLALFLIGFGLSQRFAGSEACGIPPRRA